MIAMILILTNYFIKFTSVVVMGCLQPVNWQACLPVHQWLFPQVKEGIEIWLNPDSVYKTERDYLNKVNGKIN